MDVAKILITITPEEKSAFGDWELPERVGVERAIKYFYWYGLELASRVLIDYGDELTIGAELADIKETIEALAKERGEVILTNDEMAPCGVSWERA